MYSIPDYNNQSDDGQINTDIVKQAENIVINEYIENYKGQKFGKTSADIYNDINQITDGSYIIKPDEVVIDVDNLEDSVKVLEALDYFGVTTQYVETDRGAHFYFKRGTVNNDYKNKGTSLCWLGIMIETKTDKVVVKKDNVKRPVHNEGIFEVIPYFLTKPTSKRIKLELLSNCDIGNRNNALFQHNVACSKDPYIKSRIPELFRIINDCILDVPMDKQELESVSRELEVNGQGEISIDKLISYLDSKTIHGKLFIKTEDCTYTDDTGQIVTAIQKLFNFDTQQIHRNCIEIIKALTLMSPKVDDEHLTEVCNNGYFDDDYNFVSGIYTDATPYHIDVDYNPNITEYEPIDTLLKNMSIVPQTQNTDNPIYDLQQIEYLKCMIAIPMITNLTFKRRFAKVFFIYGDASNGKSTFFDMMTNFYGRKNMSAVNIKDFANGNEIYQMQHKMLNIDADATSKSFKSDTVQVVKKICTCDTLSYKQLYFDTTSAVVSPTLFASTNFILKSKEIDGGLNRRVVYIPSHFKITQEMINARPRYAEELCTPEAKSYLLNICIEYCKKLYNGYVPTPSKLMTTFNAVQQEEENHYITFCCDYFFRNMMISKVFDKDRLQDLTKTSIKDINDAYTNWLIDNNITYSVGKQKQQDAFKLFGFEYKNFRNDEKKVVKGIVFSDVLYQINYDKIQTLFNDYAQL